MHACRSTLEDPTGRPPLTAFATVPLVYDDPMTPMNATWRLNETLACLTHLAAEGEAERVPGETSAEPERWVNKVQ